MRKIVLTFGLIAGAILGAMMLLTIPFMDRIGFDKAAIIGYTTMVLAGLMTYFGVRAYRDEVAGGTVSFGRAFQVALLITAVSTVCYAATWQLVYHKITPDFLERYTAHVIAKERAAGSSDAQIAKKAAEMEEFGEMYKNPLIRMPITFTEMFPVGVLVSLICAGLLRNSRFMPARQAAA
jgi:hypothetical protein